MAENTAILSYEDFSILQDYVSDSTKSLKSLAEHEFFSKESIPNSLHEKKIDFNGFSHFLSLYLGDDFPEDVKFRLFSSFVRRFASNFKISYSSLDCGEIEECDCHVDIDEEDEEEEEEDKICSYEFKQEISHESSRQRCKKRKPFLVRMFSEFINLSHKNTKSFYCDISKTFNSHSQSNPTCLKNEENRNSIENSEKCNVNECFDVTTKMELICVKDLLCYLSLLESGRPVDKLEFMFRLYDSDDNGALDSSEISSIIDQMMNVAKYLKWDTHELRPILMDMMREIDYDNDGQVSFDEWKRGCLNNVPLLVLLGLDMDVREDSRHVWRLKHFRNQGTCGFCLKILGRFGRQGLCCTLCKFTVHERCARDTTNLCISTYTKSRKSANQLMQHHWVPACIPLLTRQACSRCHRNLGLVNTGREGLHCRWCKRTLHLGCMSPASVQGECDLGALREHILPPTVIFPVVLERRSTYNRSFNRPNSDQPSSIDSDGRRSSSGTNSTANFSFLQIYSPAFNSHYVSGESMIDVSSAATNESTSTNQLNESQTHSEPKSCSEQQATEKWNFPNQISLLPFRITRQHHPLLVFINPKSGGKQGTRIIQQIQYLLNPRQVFDMIADKGPQIGLKFFQHVSNCRIMVCGGDGTVGWLLEAMDKHDWDGMKRPPVAILPLGTGNDLARCLRWGGGYDTNTSLEKTLNKISQGTVIMLDRWKIECSKPPSPNNNESYDQESKDANNLNSLPSLDLTQEKYNDSTINDPDQSNMLGDEIPLTIINNYFSIGVDASIAHKFHIMREKHPERFNSRMKNRLFYMEFGTSEVFTASCKNLHEHIDIICDGKLLDLRRIASKTSLEGIAVLNIPSIYGGSNLWGVNGHKIGISRAFSTKNATIRSNSLACMPKNSNQHPQGGVKAISEMISNASNSFNTSHIASSVDSNRLKSIYDSEPKESVYLACAVQDMGDRLLEVVGLENAMHAGMVVGGLRSSGRRLAQCSELTIRTRRRFPMQIDGEPWLQTPCTISISYKNQVPMIMAPYKKSHFFSSLFFR